MAERYRSPDLPATSLILLLKYGRSFLNARDFEHLDTFLDHADDNVRIELLGLMLALDETAACQRVPAMLAQSINWTYTPALMQPFTHNTQRAAALEPHLTGEVLSKDQAKQVLQILQGRGYQGKELTEALQGIFMEPVVEAQAEDREGRLKALALAVSKRGNIENGKKVYHRPGMTCVACHKIDGAGGVLGPDLSVVGRGLPLERVIDSIIWPANEVKEGYGAVTLTLKDGSTLQGYLKEKTPTVVRVANPATGAIQEVASDQVVSTSEGLMPEVYWPRYPNRNNSTWPMSPRWARLKQNRDVLPLHPKEPCSIHDPVDGAADRRSPLGTLPIEPDVRPPVSKAISGWLHFFSWRCPDK